MKFSDLLNLPAEENTNRVDRAAVFARLPDIPTKVAEQFFVDHGRNEEFQRQYASLVIDRLRWRQVHERASVLVAASMCPNFKNWFDTVAFRAAAFKEHG